MPILRPRYRVTFTTPDGPTALEVEVTYGDQLRAEFEANAQGLPPMKQVPQNHIAVWLWCALVRLGRYQDKGIKFRLEDLLDVVPLDDDPEAVPEVDPTQPAVSSGAV